MSSSKASPNAGISKTPKRALPSWMSARGDTSGEKQDNDRVDDDSRTESSQKKVGGQGKGGRDSGEEYERREKSNSVGPSKSEFSKLLDGVVFALSGFVNPERGILRSQALEMGAEYQQDWNSSCTLLVCAYHNTPKFKQVKADGGTIVSKDWIIECYTQKKLVDIEPYLMNVGKPWRKSNIICTGTQVSETPEPSKPRKQEAKRPVIEPEASSSRKELKGNASKFLRDKFSASKVKRWAVDDLEITLSWLESQEEKPEPSEIRNVAAEGILTCLQDAIDLLGKEQDLSHLAEDWNVVPRVVKELIEVQNCEKSSSISTSDLHNQAVACQKIYEEELKGTSVSSNEMNRKSNPASHTLGKGKHHSLDYDTDETIEMTEDEINDAYNSLASTIPGS